MSQPNIRRRTPPPGHVPQAPLPVSASDPSVPENNEEPYKVGKGRPPKDKRFSSENQPRKRGAKGRPKSYAAAMRALLERNYTIVEEGRRKKRNGYELVSRASFKKALNGDRRAAEHCIAVAAPDPEDLQAMAKDLPLSPGEQAAWEEMLRIAREAMGQDIRDDQDKEQGA
jgi:hypothetical protein